MTAETLNRRADALAEFLQRHGPALVLTGAGCSTASGIPDYRDRDGAWKHNPPVLFNDFVRNEPVRRRYWAGSMHGWPRIASALPNPAHHALAQLENGGFVHTLITQNVDDLHIRAGSRSLVELHGNLKTVACLQCSGRLARSDMQQALEENNVTYRQRTADGAPDGDANLNGIDLTAFRVPACPRCGGILKPEVVFFGESVPRSRTERCLEALAAANCLLAAGTSLMVFSGYRYCREARRHGLPVIAVNLGRTRADGELTMKVEADCGILLPAVSERLCPGGNTPGPSCLP